jgi:hypothetical protein
VIRCRTCRDIKPAEAFALRGDTGRRRTDCRECCAARTRAWKAERPGVSGRYSAEWRARNPERDAEQRLADRCRAYGITSKRYAEMLQEQGGHCAMCPTTPEKQGRLLAVDHDHACCPTQMRSCGRCVRGLLCSNCNTALGVVENKEFLMTAMDYLAVHSSVIPTGKG